MTTTATPLGEHLTVLGAIDAHAPDPVSIVWHHRDWCPMACKVFENFYDAGREAAILGALAHPNIVRLLGIEPPRLLLMEFLEGQTLAGRLLARGGRPLGISDAMRIVVHVGAALHHIHARGFVHLDVKPSNIMITTGGRPVLYDFGIARAILAPRPSKVCGTDAYIAPEECRKEVAGPPADVFALAMTIYELIAGTLPFGESTRRRPFPQLTAKPASACSHRKAVPAALDLLLLACFAKDPSSRPLLSELLPALHGLIRTGSRMWPLDFDPIGPPAARIAPPPEANGLSGPAP